MGKKQFSRLCAASSTKPRRRFLVFDGDEEFWLPKSKASYEKDPCTGLED